MRRITGTDPTFPKSLQFSVKILHPTETWGEKRKREPERWLIPRRSRLVQRLLHGCGVETCPCPPDVP